MCCFIDSSVSRSTPRSWTTSTGLRMSESSCNVRSLPETLSRICLEPNQISSVLSVFNCSLRIRHPKWRRSAILDLDAKMQKGDFLKKTKQFRAMVWRPIGSYVIGLFKEPITGSLKSKMAEIRHLEKRHDVIFFWWGRSDFDKISQIGVEWHVDCADMVKLENRCRIPMRRTFGRNP